MNSPFSNTGRLGNIKSDYAILGLVSALGGTTASGQEHGSNHIRNYSQDISGMFLSSVSKKCSKKTIVDCGDLEPSTRNLNEYLKNIETEVNSISKNTRCVITLGGDDSVSYGVARGLLKIYPDLAILHFDAHSDKYGKSGEPLDHSNWVMWLEKKTRIPIRQIGVRAVTHNLPSNKDIRDRPLFISIDMDVIDPAFAQGVACPVPFGMYPRELMTTINQFLSESKCLVGIGITEIAPKNDLNHQTADLANSILEQIIYRN